MRPLDNFIQKIAQKPIFHKEFFAKMESFPELEYTDVEDLKMLQLLGLPIVKYTDHALSLATTTQSIVDQKFCIVDIETNGSKPTLHQIIEIGAVMVKNGRVIGEFNSLAYTDILPDSIHQLTGITLAELEKAPPLKSVLADFRLFLQDAVFVAHNVNFDYYFISYAMEKAGFGPLLNRRLCTIDLARKTLNSPKYGLSALTEHLNIPFEHHHRALWDAKATALVFARSLENVPQEVITTEALIAFSKPTQQKKKEKKMAKPLQTPSLFSKDTLT
ncbi:MAG: 3'-5' exonuclease [Sulfurospirillaceae bacterium]|nr:3'-5' exonuclease [Sulfurospirillaceae bacterium]